MKKANYKNVLETYKLNEDLNFHTENLLILALWAGDDYEVDYCQGRLASRSVERDVELEKKINQYYYKLVKLAKKELALV